MVKSVHVIKLNFVSSLFLCNMENLLIIQTVFNHKDTEI